MFWRAFLFCLLLTAPSLAQDRARIEQQFQVWLMEDIWPEAQRAGVSRATYEAAFRGVSLQWDLPDLVPPGQSAPAKRPQRQTEFGAPSAYFRTSALQSATSIGRDMARVHAGTLSRLTEQSGVPGHILLAIWGRESAYGRAPIRENAFRVLATKGFMSTRKAYFRTELIAALSIAEDHPIAPKELRSSWAGALGQPQFMPSNYLAYATDGDGDGRADIWDSEADTLASIATYLTQHGWVAGRDWGFEVRLPDDLACTSAGPDQRQPVRVWVERGITRVNNRPFPEHELEGDASLLLPAGTYGPAFLVTPNFYVLKDYNFSDLYALFVGHVGDRIAFGMRDFHAAWTPVDQLYRSDIARFQRALEAQGYDVGGADGLVGFKTRRAIGLVQEQSGDTPTCFPDASMIQ